jgi:hypothetical protein
VSQKDVYTKLIFRIIICIHLFGILCIIQSSSESDVFGKKNPRPIALNMFFFPSLKYILATVLTLST